MGRFVRGDIVVVPFPFSATPGFKKRPALIIASWTFGAGEDYLLCLISTQTIPDPYSIALETEDVENGSLHRASYVRPTYLFAADESLIERKIGNLKPGRFSEVITALRSVLHT
jgi:mRNA interferase MazF